MTDDPDGPRELPSACILGKLPPPVLEAFIGAGRFVLASQGEYLAVQGQHHHALAAILDGEVTVTAHAHGDTVPLATLKAGDLVGEMSIIDPHPASANVRVASAGARLWIIDGESFERFVEGGTTAGLAVVRLLAKTLCKRIRHDSETMLHRADELRSHFLDMDY